MNDSPTKKHDKFFLSMADVEEAVKQKMAELKPILIKQKTFVNTVSLWNFQGRYFEITQNTNGNYTVYLMSKQEAEQWDNDDGEHCEDLGGQKIGTPADILISESVILTK